MYLRGICVITATYTADHECARECTSEGGRGGGSGQNTGAGGINPPLSYNAGVFIEARTAFITEQFMARASRLDRPPARPL